MTLGMGLFWAIFRGTHQVFITANILEDSFWCFNSTCFPESCLLGHPESDYDDKAVLKQPKSLTSLENPCQHLPEGSECSSRSTDIEQCHELQTSCQGMSTEKPRRGSARRTGWGHTATRVCSVPASRAALTLMHVCALYSHRLFSSCFLVFPSFHAI